MKRILQLIRCEFVKDFSLVKIALCGVILFLVSWIFLSFVSNIYYRYHETPREFYQENVYYIIQDGIMRLQIMQQSLRSIISYQKMFIPTWFPIMRMH